MTQILILCFLSVLILLFMDVMNNIRKAQTKFHTKLLISAVMILGVLAILYITTQWSIRIND